ncbi:unnamed protein product [Heligmosomoides polygyrus]|uniref:Uncharacterized protein n=1 Tax=Heligmosomoides polygyrus TaxID=6339 RepID=A0A183FE57_HELPZ|nr:unnamed protein product [Heligmosomoides polygyrus]
MWAFQRSPKRKKQDKKKGRTVEETAVGATTAAQTGNLATADTQYDTAHTTTSATTLETSSVYVDIPVQKVGLSLPKQKPSRKRESPRKPPTQTRKLASRPVHEKSLIEMAAKVRRRKSRDTPKSARSTQRSVDEDPFPQPAPPGKKGKKKPKKQKQEEAFVPRIDSAFLLPDTEGPEVFGDRSIEMGVRPTGNTLPGSGLPVVKGNKDNDGMLLDETDDDLVMNAAVLIDVLENRLKLVPMPDIEIVLDPMEETTVLAARDKSCYTKDVIFGNTVRSMVNLNDREDASQKCGNVQQSVRTRRCSYLALAAQAVPAITVGATAGSRTPTVRPRVMYL